MPSPLKSRIALVSPHKPTLDIEVPHPLTRTGVQAAAAAATEPNPDLSWDLIKYQLSPGRTSTIGERPRSAERAQKRRQMLAPTLDMLDDVRGSVQALMEKYEQLQAEIHMERRERQRERDIERRELQRERDIERREWQREIEMERRERQHHVRQQHQRLLGIQRWRIQEKEQAVRYNQLTEAYETVDRCLRGFNDIIFDTERNTNGIQMVLTQNEKYDLKHYKLNYITRLLRPPTDLNSEVNNLRLRALNVLTVDQQRLCHRLLELFYEVKGNRNDQHHPRPDRDTARRCLWNYLDPSQRQALDSFLTEDPRRLPMSNDLYEEDPDTLLFARPYDYAPVADQWAELDDLKATLDADIQSARVATRTRRRRP